MHELSLKLQEFFFEAALATYAGSAPKTSIEGLPKSKVYRYERDNYMYIDTYFTNGEQSGGQTIIYIKPEGSPTFVPAWIMQYHGWCKDDDPKVLAFLKEALRATYEEGVFHGGRGSVMFPFCGQVRTITNDDYLIYRNDAGRILPCAFHRFSGEERIYRSHDKHATNGWKEVFWHRYQGMTLLPEVQQEK